MEKYILKQNLKLEFKSMMAESSVEKKAFEDGNQETVSGDGGGGQTKGGRLGDTFQ